MKKQKEDILWIVQRKLKILILSHFRLQWSHLYSDEPVKQMESKCILDWFPGFPRYPGNLTPSKDHSRTISRVKFWHFGPMFAPKKQSDSPRVGNDGWSPNENITWIEKLSWKIEIDMSHEEKKQTYYFPLNPGLGLWRDPYFMDYEIIPI